jgi:spore maturation protein CgeB
VNQSRFPRRRVTIIGNRGGTNIGSSFERAALASNLDVQFIDPRQAMSAPSWLRRFNWYLRGRRPTGLSRFSARVVEACLRHQSQMVVVTGIAGLTAGALRKLRDAGIRVANYLTDDPWNPVHRASWFLEALPEYFALFSPRRANLADLQDLGSKTVIYLPFAYDPELHFPEVPSLAESQRFSADVLFVGGADKDRIPLCAVIAESGLDLAIYGDYWDRYRRTRASWKGYADPATLRKATSAARVCLCVSRKANRDAHTMRSYEAPAMAGVILAEATDDHVKMFGKNGALYFADIPEMITKAKWLVTHETEARQMAEYAHARITGGINTYADRLSSILAVGLSA